MLDQETLDLLERGGIGGHDVMSGASVNVDVNEPGRQDCAREIAHLRAGGNL